MLGSSPALTAQGDNKRLEQGLQGTVLQLGMIAGPQLLSSPSKLPTEPTACCRALAWLLLG